MNGEEGLQKEDGKVVVTEVWIIKGRCGGPTSLQGHEQQKCF